MQFQKKIKQKGLLFRISRSRSDDAVSSTTGYDANEIGERLHYRRCVPGDVHAVAMPQNAKGLVHNAAGVSSRALLCIGVVLEKISGPMPRSSSSRISE